MTREIATRTRRDLASWQKAALGLLALSVGANTLLYGAILSRDKKIDNLETRYQAAKAIQQDAVAAYGKLVAQVDAEKQERAARTAAYEAIEGYEYIGECKITYYAADTGGAIKGNHVDIAVPTHQEALELGTKTAEVWIVG